MGKGHALVIGAFGVLVGAAAHGSALLVINEFVKEHTGGLDENEFIEVWGSPNFDYSTYTILEIEGDGANAGKIEHAWTVGTTDANGIWWTGFLVNTIDNGDVSFLLVEGFTGAVGDDIDADNDGAIDTSPWSFLADAVSSSDVSVQTVYGTPDLPASYDGNSNEVGGASRIPDGFDTDLTTDWVRNDFDCLGAAMPCGVGTNDANEAINTPGLPNMVTPVELMSFSVE